MSKHHVDTGMLRYIAGSCIVAQPCTAWDARQVIKDAADELDRLREAEREAKIFAEAVHFALADPTTPPTGDEK